MDTKVRAHEAFVTGSIVLELLAKSKDTLLSDLINDEGSAAAPDWEPCWCGPRPSCDATCGVIRTRAALNCVNFQTSNCATTSTRYHQGRQHAATVMAKNINCDALCNMLAPKPLAVIMLPSCSWRNDTFVIFDDEATRYCDTVQDAVWQNARLFAHEEIAESLDHLSVQ